MNVKIHLNKYFKCKKNFKKKLPSVTFNTVHRNFRPFLSEKTLNTSHLSTGSTGSNQDRFSLGLHKAVKKLQVGGGGGAIIRKQEEPSVLHRRLKFLCPFFLVNKLTTVPLYGQGLDFMVAFTSTGE